MMSSKNYPPPPKQHNIPKIDLGKIREEVAFYRETIDYLMNRGMTFANCIRILALMQLGQSFPEALLETFTEQGREQVQ